MGAAITALEIDILGRNTEPVWPVLLATSIIIILLDKLGVAVVELVLLWGREGEEEEEDGPGNRSILATLRLLTILVKDRPPSATFPFALT